MSLNYDLNEYRAIMSLHNAACEAWGAYTDPARCSMSTVRAKNEADAALGCKVADTLRELQRLRGQRLVMLDLLSEAAHVIHNLPDEAETQYEADRLSELKDKIADARCSVLLDLVEQRASVAAPATKPVARQS